MKKMIVLVCAAAIVGMVQAAAVGWTLAGCNNYAGDAYSFFVIGQNGVDSVAQITALCADGKDVSAYAFGGGLVSGAGAANVTTSASGKSLDSGATYDSFFVLFDSADTSKAGNYLAITSEQAAGLKKTVAASAGSFTFAGANQSTYVNTASNWSKVQGSGVPEPTSGLLLLMGMAALALKRKVA